MRIIHQVRDHARQLATAGLPRLRSLLLDFDRCSAIDSSAVSVLFQCCRRAQLEPGGLVFACASPSVLPMLRRASPRVPFEHFTTLDLALEYCENRADLESGASSLPPGMFDPAELSGPPTVLPGVLAADEAAAIADAILGSTMVHNWTYLTDGYPLGEFRLGGYHISLDCYSRSVSQ